MSGQRRENRQWLSSRTQLPSFRNMPISCWLERSKQSLSPVNYGNGNDQIIHGSSEEGVLTWLIQLGSELRESYSSPCTKTGGQSLILWAYFRILTAFYFLVVRLLGIVEDNVTFFCSVFVAVHLWMLLLEAVGCCSPYKETQRQIKKRTGCVRSE